MGEKPHQRGEKETKGFRCFLPEEAKLSEETRVFRPLWTG